MHTHLQAIAFVHVNTYIVVSGMSKSLTGVAIIAGLERGFSDLWGEPAGSESYIWVETARAWSCVPTASVLQDRGATLTRVAFLQDQG